MESAVFSGVRIWRCTHRGHLVFESMTTGHVCGEVNLTWRRQEDSDV
jgi:hypothetical protein